MAGATRAATKEMPPPTTTSVPLKPGDEEPSPLQAFCKAFPGSGSPSDQPGPCPFSQKILVALEERGLPYVATYIEEGPNKPDWFMKHNPSGLIPVLRDGEEWIQDTDKIIEHLNSKYPSESKPFQTPPNAMAQAKKLTEALFGTFTKWLQSKDVNNPAGKEYEQAVKDLNDHLEKHGPFVAGKNPTDADFDLAPKFRHARTCLLSFMDFVLPSTLSAVHQYIQLMESRPSFRRTDAPDHDIIYAWQKKFELPERVPLMQGA